MFTVVCPVCGGRLTVDERRKQVTSHLTKEEAAKSGEERFDDAVARVEKSSQIREKKLTEAEAEREKRRKRARELFGKAQEE